MRTITIDSNILSDGVEILSPKPAFSFGGGEKAGLKLKIPAAGGGISLTSLRDCSERYLCFTIEVHEDHSQAMELVFWLRGEKKGATLHGARFGLMPRFPALICLDLQWLDGHILFPGHTPGELKVVWIGGRVEREEIESISLETRPSFHDVTLSIAGMVLTDEYPAAFPLPDVKLVDEFGQNKKKDWPGKIKNLDELKTKLNRVLEKPDAYPIADWSKYGGWTKKKLAPGTGYFTKMKKDGRWWLADPEGYAFFSAGPDCVNISPDCRIDDMEKTLDWIPSRDDPDYKDFFKTAQRYAKNDDMRRPNGVVFSYSAANLFRVFGKDWNEKWEEIVFRQLKSAGMNTIGNWSGEDILKKSVMPYVIPLQRFPETKVNIFRDFPDVLSDEYKNDAKECAKYLIPLADDPYMIGYFLRNEPMWAFVNNLIIADEVLYNPAPSACKDALIQFLREKYKTPETLSGAWNHSFVSFDDLRKPLQKASAFSEKSLADIREFSRILLKAYVTIPSAACREADPHHMNLGMRWAWISDPDIITGWENFDVFSINCYFEDPTPALDNVRNLGVDLPVIIGEFHFGALDQGLSATGLKGTPNQRERGKAYRYYCERVAAHPYGAGCHWFQLYDQFLLGRFDGENYNIGLVDVCSLPQEEMMDAVRNCAEVIYRVADGAEAPFKDVPKYIPMIAF